MRYANSAWTDAATAELKTLWASGNSATQIAVILGSGLSRNAVIGKVTRLKLAKRDAATCARLWRRSSRSAPPRLTPPTTMARSPPRPAKSKPANRPVKPRPFLGIALLDLTPTHCRYPHDVADTTLFCGQPRQDLSSYCPHHDRSCHTTGGSLWAPRAFPQHLRATY